MTHSLGIVNTFKENILIPTSKAGVSYGKSKKSTPAMLHQNYHCTPNRQKVLTALTQSASVVSLSTLGLATGLEDMEIRVALRKLAVAGVVEYSEAGGWVEFELH